MSTASTHDAKFAPDPIWKSEICVKANSEMIE